jgi:hypothetical protein
MAEEALWRKTVSNQKRANASSAVLELSRKKYMTISLSDVSRFQTRAINVSI